jgi:uncharacterized Tic20 family protein
MSESAARPSDQDRLFAVLSHAGGLFTSIILPVVLLLIQQDRRSFAAWHAREAVNFNLTVLLYQLILMAMMGLACLILWFLVEPLMLIFALLAGLLLALGLIAFQLLVVVVASIKAYWGAYCRCPLTIRFVAHPGAVADAAAVEQPEVRVG